MQGTMTITCTDSDFAGNSKRSPIESGPLKLPDEASVLGQLIAIGEDDRYLHCIVSVSGAYFGVFKSGDEKHLYQHLLRLNTRPK
jgi:hypothetical protein